MAATDLSRKQPTYAIVYGLFGRPAQARKLRELLEARGLRPAADIGEADILITHSAGCWLVPKTAQARLVIWNGAPLAEKKGKTYRQANIQIYKRTPNTKLIKFLASNTLYGFRYFRRNLAIIRMAKYAEPVILPEAAYVFIANRYDPWPRSRKVDTFLKNKDWAFMSLPGSHDDIWQHPDHYAPIINHYARLLAETDG